MDLEHQPRAIDSRLKSWAKLRGIRELAALATGAATSRVEHGAPRARRIASKAASTTLAAPYAQERGTASDRCERRPQKSVGPTTAAALDTLRTRGTGQSWTRGAS
jgi:hypothetical protein